MNRLKRKEADRPRCFWGALISAGLGIAGALLNSNAQKKQRRLQANLEDYNNSLEEAQGMTNVLNAGQDYQQNYLQQFKQQARLGTTRRLGSRNIMITDGGNAKRIGNNTYLLRGGSHEDINETGQTGIGINVGGNEIEAEGGEVAQRKGNSLRIYSAQPILGGMSPAQAIMRGYNKDKVFNAQQRFKKNNGIKDDGSQQRNGGEVPYNHYDPTGLFGGSPHPLAKIIDITGITSYGDVKKLIDKKRRGEIPTTQEYLGALSAIPAIGRIAKGLNLIGNIADATTFMKDVKESEAKENTYQNEIVKYRDIHGKIKTGRRGSMPYTAHELRKRYGGLTSKDRGSSKHPYPSVSSKDFAGSNRSYPIPTKADAVDALRLAGLHGRSDVRSKIYSKYPELRKKARGGTKVDPYYDWARNTSSNLGISFIDPTYDYRTYYNSVTPYERNLIRFAPQGTHFTDIGKTPKHPTFSNESIYSNKKHSGGTWNGNVFVPNIWQFGNNGNKVRNKYMNNSGEGYFNGRVNVFPKYRKKAEIGTNISLDSSYGNKDFLHRITQGHPTARKIINEIFGDEADRRRVMQDLNLFGLTSDDASGIAGASPIFRQPIVSAARQAQFIQNANKARQAANANKARQAANYAQQQVDYIKELSDRMSATIRNVGEQLGIRVNPNPNNSVRRLYSSNFKPTNTNNRITTPRETPINSSNSFTETPINSTTTSATNTPTYSGKTTKFNTKYRSYRNAGFSPRTSKNLVKANKLGLYSTIGGFGTIGAGTLIGANINKTDKANKTSKAQLDAKGKPISKYIARPQESAKPQAKKSVPVRKDTIATKPVTRQVPDSIARKDTTRTNTTRTDTTRTNTTKQVNKVVKRQVRTIPQYKGNTTKGNYQLHDGETKIINGVKYTRRGNTIINHKTNVGYIYDKNGNYTGQADYSKVGNFNQAFDAARAAGRSQFIYRAGKYNNYSTVKETNAKKEALNRRIGASRIAKRMGCLTNPPVGSRKKYLPGGIANPWDKYRFTDYTTPNTWNEKYGISNVPDYGGVSPWQISNKYDVNVPYSISKYDLPITTITAKKNTFNDEMSKRMRAGVQNLKDDSDSKTTVPYLGKQLSFKPTTQDYIGLGIDTLASLGIGLINSSAASKTYLPERTAIIQASKLPTYYNVSPQVEEIKRQRDILNGEIANNTSSSVAALNRISRIRDAATGEINKLYATKENEENKMLTQDALNQQQVAAENAKLQADYETNKANILNAASQAKANALSGTLSGLSQAWTNFASSIENRYNTRQNEAIIAATAKDPAVLSNAIQFGYNFSPEILAGVYNSTKDENLKDLVLSQLNNKNRRKYGIK